MGIIGRHPETGVRIEIERPRESGPPWCYRGEAVTPTARHPVTVVVSPQGEVSVELPAEAPSGLARRVRLIVRAAVKNAEDDGAPPRRIMRWRSDG